MAIAFAAEEGGGGAEIATHGASDRRNDGRGCVAAVIGHAHAEDTEAKAREYFRVHDRRTGIFAEITPHPGDTFTPHNLIGVEHVFDVGNSGNVTADNNDRLW